MWKIKLPHSLINLTFNQQHHCPFPSKVPSTLKKLKGYIRGDNLKNLPCSIEEVGIVVDCTDFLKHVIPASVRKLQIGNNFDLPWDSLPPFLTHLTLDSTFRVDRRVDNLPSTLTHITFGQWTFNQPVDKLPPTLTHLDLEYSGFDQPVDHLPPTLTHLYFGYTFNQPVDHLPSTLTHLSFGDEFNQKVDNLPRSLQYLKFGSKFQTPWSNLPSVKHLSFSRATFLAPSKLSRLTLPRSITNFEYGKPESSDVKHSAGYFKPNLHSPGLEYFHLAIEVPTAIQHKLHYQALKQATYEIYYHDEKSFRATIKTQVKINFETQEIDVSTLVIILFCNLI